jgi:hypothetical protein
MDVSMSPGPYGRSFGTSRSQAARLHASGTTASLPMTGDRLNSSPLTFLGRRL